MWLLWFLASFTCALGAHESRNDSQVVVTYSGHAEAPQLTHAVDTASKSHSAVTAGHADTEYLEHKTAPTEPTNDGVVFVPSGNTDIEGYSRRTHVNPEKELRRNKEVRVNDVVMKHTLGDIINDRVVRVEKEHEDEGVLFISGKNNENMEHTIKKEEETRRSNKEVKELKKVAAAPLDCNNLNCNNVLKSVCGVKLEQRKPKYRLFLNECYFRKVNCGFSYDYNRYSVAPPEKCANVGSHFSQQQEPQFLYRYQPLLPQPQQNVQKIEDIEKANSRRSFSGRRAMTTNMDGKFCAHACPAHCPEDYAPECAVSSTTQLKVFLNHCLMDLHSCTYGSVWQRRPLSDCIGNKKAEVQSNKAFIGWMQRVGIVDKKGRMVLS